MKVLVESADGDLKLMRATEVGAASDFTGKVRVDGLASATEYHYRVWFSAGDLNRRAEHDRAEGSFHTPPQPDVAAPVGFAFGGDLGGQNACRDRKEGYPVFHAILAQEPDFFAAVGDMIYADGNCRSVGRYGNEQIPRSTGRAVDLNTFWSHWRYNRADDAFRALLAEVPYEAIWDDHEVLNDFGPGADQPWWGSGTLRISLLPIGLQAFLDYNPIAEHPDRPGRLYRTLRWGRHLELFVLDTRQYRDPSEQRDRPDRQKTLLGLEQLRWLGTRLAASDATWKVVVSSVPMAIPTGSDPDRGMDSWANYKSDTGYEHELVSIVRFLHEQGIRNSLWITTDVHFAAVYRHTPFPGDPGFQIHEVATGPLSAGVFDNELYDESLGTERLFFGPGTRERPETWRDAARAFNFGVVEISEAGQLSVHIVDARGAERHSFRLKPQ